MDKARLAVAIMLLDRFQLTSFAALADTLGHARRAGDRIEVMSPTGKPAKAVCGTEIGVTLSPVWPEGFDYVVVLGSLGGRLWRNSSTVGRFLRTADRLGVTLVGIESGIETLARQGLLNGQAACAAARDLDRLQHDYPDVRFRSGTIIVEDRRRLTGLGGAAAADLAALLVSRGAGREAAHLAMVSILLDGARDPMATPPVQLQGVTTCHPKVRHAIERMMTRLADPGSIETLANGLDISRRQLDRLCLCDTGATAKGLFMRLRLQEASVLLQAGTMSTADVAWATGFTDAPHLSRSLRKHAGQSVRERRQQGGRPSVRPRPVPADQPANQEDP